MDAPPPPGFSRYLTLFAPYKWLYAWGLLLLFLSNAFTLAVPRLIKAAVDRVAPPQGGDASPSTLWAPFVDGPWRLAGTLVAVGLILALARTASRVVILGVGRRVARDLRRQVFGRLLVAAPSFFARFPTGEIMSRSIGDISLLQGVASPGILYTFNAVFMFSIAVPYLAWIDPSLTLYLLLPFPPLAVTTMFAATRVRRYAREAQEAMDRLSTRIQEALGGIDVIRAFTLEAEQAERFTEANDEYLTKSVQQALVRGVITIASVLTGGIGTFVLLWIGGQRVADHTLSYGDLALFFGVMGLVLRPTIYLGWVLSLGQRGLASLERLDQLLLAPRAIVSPEAPEATGPVRGTLEARAISYRYPGDLERREALKGISFEVAQGKSLGLTGRIGSGKSTLLRAIPRLLVLTGGELLVDGVTLERWDLAALRSGIGYVPQDGYVFSLSLGENVAFGAPDATPAQILEAAKVAELEKDLDQLEDGLETVIGERGVTLSGGQRQRLAIARAVLIRPPILLLDDALSMIDAETAVQILKNLRQALPETTLLVAAHRTATLLGVDELLVMHEGEVVERGAPAALLADADSRFAHMHERQKLEASLRETL
ncbi:MAG: ABC transporter ATP-binding protein [Planctomycetes bacterium]|nr:ABC transporter ATP-binding protein [Planctomycetota bacterium]